MGRRVVVSVLLLLGVVAIAPVQAPTARAAAIPGAIAYAGTDGNIWTMQPDGSAKQRLTNAAPGQRFGHPRWSPDGSMLVFDAKHDDVPADADPYDAAGTADGIYLYRDGVVARIQGPADCGRPTFFPDGRRLASACALGLLDFRDSDEQLRTDPAFGAVSTSALDGTGWRILVPYRRGSILDLDSRWVRYIAISPNDGTLLLDDYGNDQAGGVLLANADGGDLRPVAFGQGYLRKSATFAATGDDLVLFRCSGCGIGPQPTPTAAFVRTARDGTGEKILASLVLPPFDTSPPTVAPDGQALAYSYVNAASAQRPTTGVYVVSIPNGTPRKLADGSDPAWRPASARECFPQTGKCIQGRLLAYWQAHGGLAINGYPISDEFTQTLEDGKPYVVQYFERVRLEYHPENPPPYDILLGQFGRRILAGVPDAPTAPTAPQDGQTFFAPTGHNVGGPFLAYWQANGGLAQFGYPLTEMFSQQLEDGKTYTVQYFERARFEAHPENSPPYNVELGQFGRRILVEAGW